MPRPGFVDLVFFRPLIALAMFVMAGDVASGESLWKGARNQARHERDRLVATADRHLALAREYKASGPVEAAELHAQAAIKAYEQALLLPRSGVDDAELHYRAFIAARRYLNDSSPTQWSTVLRHVDGLRAADPDDPRNLDLTEAACHALARIAAQGTPDAEQLFQLGIAEYRHWFADVDEADPRFASLLATNHSNIAELLMATGRIDEAIQHYRIAVDLNSGEPLHFYGLAVAYDRAGYTSLSYEVMRSALDLDPDLRRLHMDTVYFVPEGDVFYYEALAHRVAGRKEAALSSLRRFISEAKPLLGAYKHRAREHVLELTGHAPRR
ncbi:MAG: hypothetical protein HY698_04055 [Deltaproteobacteria bacterium]|nr:hypothetical protein [Deltaproteobacteria bacterium]